MYLGYGRGTCRSGVSLEFDVTVERGDLWGGIFGANPLSTYKGQFASAQSKKMIKTNQKLHQRLPFYEGAGSRDMINVNTYYILHLATISVDPMATKTCSVNAINTMRIQH